ncbi:hypothetical protein JM654_21585 [Microbacterium oxydans]|nr:hypothetical protein [Microbacterium oxydans]
MPSNLGLDTSCSGRLVSAQRSRDQAGRYAVAIENLATDDELRAYASMLRHRRRRSADARTQPPSRRIEIEIETREAEAKAATAAARRNVVGDIAGYRGRPSASWS